jgi:uncharacterized ion transporter superfamily protein YfcC
MLNDYYVIATVGFSGVPFPSLMLLLVMVVVFCYSYSTKVEKEEEVSTTQEYKKPVSKRNLRNSKLGGRKTMKNLSLSTLSDRE